MLNNVSIKARLVFVLCVLSALLFAGAGLGMYGMSKGNEGLKTVYEDRTIPLDQLTSIEMLLFEDQIALAAAILNPSAGEIRARIAEIESNTGEIDRIWREYMGTYLTPDEQRLASQFANVRGRFMDEGLKPAVEFLRGGKVAQAQHHLTGVALGLFKPVKESVRSLVDLQIDVARQEYEASNTLYLTMRFVAGVGLALGLLLACVMGIGLVRAIVRPLDEAVRVAGAIASGDLTQRIEVTRRDETGRLLAAMKQMSENLSELVSRATEASLSVATGSRQIAGGNANLSQRTEEQASSLEETASSMEELTATVKQNADNARQASQLAKAARESAETGGEVVAEAVAAMAEINESSKRVADIVGVIDEIAFQTNLLALNAAVEAARAGEQGRGFAVVASEVRNLAQRSATSAKEIKDLIGDSVRKVNQGAELVGRSGQTLHEIVSGVKKVTDIVAEIAAASQEQSAGIEQVNRAVMQMDEMTQQNAALVEEAAAASRSMEEQADLLSGMLAGFKVAGEGRSRTSAAGPAGQRSAAGGARQPQASVTRIPQRERPAARSDTTPESAARPAARVAAGGGGNEWQEF